MQPERSVKRVLACYLVTSLSSPCTNRTPKFLLQCWHVSRCVPVRTLSRTDLGRPQCGQITVTFMNDLLSRMCDKQKLNHSRRPLIPDGLESSLEGSSEEPIQGPASIGPCQAHSTQDTVSEARSSLADHLHRKAKRVYWWLRQKSSCISRCNSLRRPKACERVQNVINGYFVSSELALSTIEQSQSFVPKMLSNQCKSFLASCNILLTVLHWLARIHRGP